MKIPKHVIRLAVLTAIAAGGCSSNPTVFADTTGDSVVTRGDADPPPGDMGHDDPPPVDLDPPPGDTAVGGDTTPPIIAPVWTELGGSASGGGVSNHAAPSRCKRVVVDGSGTVHVGWVDPFSGVEEVYLRYWNGSSWASIGSSGQTGGISQGSGVSAAGLYSTCLGDIAFNSSQQPHVAWMNWDGTNQPVYLRYWNGTAWVGLGGSDSGGGVTPQFHNWWPRMAMDGNRPVLAYNRAAEIYEIEWNGAAWAGLAGSQNYPGIADVTNAAAALPSLALGAGGARYVAWVDQRSGPFEVYLELWSGSAWAGLGGSAAGSGLSALGGVATCQWPTVLVGTNGPVVAWADEAAGGSVIHVRRWNGTLWQSYGAWATLADAGVTSGAASHPAMALDASGHPIIVWEAQDVVGVNIHGARWDGSAWLSLDPATGGGISASSTASSWPSVVRAPDNSLYVAWEEEVSLGVVEVYLRRTQL